MTAETIRIGTRTSRLAMAQSGLVARAIETHLARPVELVGLSTRGDRTAGPLQAAGGKGLFTAELEQALRDGTIDLAVHSAKDMPAEMPAELTIAATLPRGDVRDVLISPCSPTNLPRRARIGTSSPRRSAQLRAIRPDVEIVAVRGNVETRIERVLGPDGDLHGVILTAAGLDRLELTDPLSGSLHPLRADTMIPAAGQATLAIQSARANWPDALGGLNHAETLAALQAERSVVRALQADCHSCLAVYIAPQGAGWAGLAMAARPDGSDPIRLSEQGASARQVGGGLTARLKTAGAADRLLGR